MARHIMAVCVVCLLCAEHLPCKEHYLDENVNKEIVLNQVYPTDNSAMIHSDQKTPLAISSTIYDKRKEKTKTNHKLVKRHSDHGHDHDHDHHYDEKDEIKGEFQKKLDEKINDFMVKIFKDFGDINTMTMDGVGFENMMKRLDLYRLVTDKFEEKTNTNHHEDEDDSNSCINSINFINRTTVQSDLLTKPVAPANTTTNKNMTNLEKVKKSLSIDKHDIMNICPILLYQLSVVDNSTMRAGCISPDSLPQSISVTHIETDPSIDAAVWLYSTLAIVGVSLCGLLGVAVIPCMDKHFYHHALQFLVALAVGTLCGDALLHLLPHAMMASSSSTNHHDDMMFKGLAAVAGIVFFYFMERLLTIAAELYKSRVKKDKPSSRVRVMRDPELNSLHNTTGGEKLCKSKYSSYPYCYDEIAMDTKDDHHEHNHVDIAHNNHNNILHKCSMHGDHGDHTNEYTGLKTKDDPSPTDNNTVSTNLDDASIESEQTNNHKGKIRPENYTIILREHETKHHGHSHTHGHVHSPPGSLSAVAWMVIMGDGLHNFTDGMTIGAAFANNIAGGFSTAIAVFCHELPHELGDFAVLLKAGMSAKQAVYYNLLSSILSFFGMLLGIFVGHQPEASAWIFAVAAGLFLYIALVDMIPELTSSHGAEESCKTSEFLLQFFGMSAGFGIMFLIAIYEHDLKMMFMH